MVLYVLVGGGTCQTGCLEADIRPLQLLLHSLKVGSVDMQAKPLSRCSRSCELAMRACDVWRGCGMVLCEGGAFSSRLLN